MQNVHTIGIIGLGSFGRFMVTLLPQDKDLIIRGYDQYPLPVKDVKLDSLDAVIASDIVIMAVPLDAYPEILAEVAKHIRPETLLIDICSVKVYPEQHIATYLPEHPNLLLSHPLFGPQSASDSTVGHKLIVTKVKGKLAHDVVDYTTNDLGLEVHRMTAEDHDRLMAQVHVLTFFVARGLSSMELKEVPFITPSYKMITDLVAFDQTHTDELFKTIQQGNPFADEMRQRIIESLTTIENTLTEKIQ